LQQCFKHGAGLGAVFREDIPLADVIGALAARQRGLVEGDMADEVKRVQILSCFVSQWLQ
jgi:hypothetical protein